MFGLRRVTVLLCGALAAVSGVHLAAQWYGESQLSGATQVALVPLLAGAVLTQVRRPHDRFVKWVLLALGSSWLGDTLPRFAGGDTAFLLMVGFFLLAQLAFIAAFKEHVDHSILHVGRMLLLPYATVVGALVVLCAPGAGSLLVPVLAYGLCLGAMAVLATGVNGLVWTGGTVFLVSDGLIAVEAFSDRLDVPHNSFWVMLTYIVAQLLIVLGTMVRSTHDSDGGRPVTTP